MVDHKRDELWGRSQAENVIVVDPFGVGTLPTCPFVGKGRIRFLDNGVNPDRRSGRKKLKKRERGQLFLLRFLS